MSGDIFYSGVYPEVQAELNARGLSGKRRNTADLNFMLGKIANTAIIAYGKQKSTNEYVLIPESLLNGDRVRSGEYLPGGKNGFLAERPYERREGDTTTPGVNASRRIPPYVTSVDINVTDHSIGLLNSCTFNITVPNPEQDLEYIESIYCRPGRPVKVTIEYPESAVLSDNNIITSSSMQSLAALKIETKPEKQTLNKTEFQGLIINFSISYQPDMTAIVNVTMRGTTNVFTDVTAIVDSAKQTDVKTNTQVSSSINIYEGINKEFNKNIIEAEKKDELNNRQEDHPFGLAYVVKYVYSDKQFHGLVGKAPEAFSEEYKFISLGWLISFVNREILSKIEGAVREKPSIVLDSNVSLSGIGVNTALQSANPYDVFIPYNSIVTQEEKLKIRDESEGRTDTNLYYVTQYFPQTKIDCIDLINIPIISDKKTPFSELTPEQQQERIERGLLAGPVKEVAEGIENIMINLEKVEEIYKSLEDSTTHLVKLNLFLDKIFKLIKKNTGDFIDLHLVTHPEESSKLVLYNVSYKPITPQKTTVEPYSVPMFANHPYGTVVTDFQFNGTLPADSANLAFAINDLDSDTTTSDIAPFLNFMYSSNELSRSRKPNEFGIDVVTDSVDPLITLDEMQDRYKRKRAEALGKWNAAKKAFSEEPDNQDNINAMYTTIREWSTYIRKDFKEQYNVKNPIIPFEVSFTINGINGFKWGDVLTFEGLPSRYKRNTVFSIISINHQLTDTGEWKTVIKCLTRAKID